jgi:hypothetical protein
MDLQALYLIVLGTYAWHGFSCLLGVTLVSEFVGVEMIYFNFTMDKDATMASVSLQPSQGLTKRSVNLSAGSCHSDLASERVSRILNMNLKI